MRSRAALLCVVTGGLLATLTAATVTPAAAQGDPVGGAGNHYYLAGAGNETGRATLDLRYGNPGDDVLVGDWDGDGTDGLIVRRGNRFLVRNDLSDGVAEHAFDYGDAGDTVLVGDWDGDGADTLAVRRGNRYFIKNDLETGVAGTVVTFGEPTDQVLVGNWDMDTPHDDAAADLSDVSDTLMVRRGNHFFVRDSMTSGPGDHDFYFGDPGDTLLVGSFAHPANRYLDGPEPRKEVLDPGHSADGADQLVVRRGNRYFRSEPPWFVAREPGRGLITWDDITYGNPDDTAFIAKLPYTQPPMEGVTPVLYGDGLAVRRND